MKRGDTRAELDLARRRFRERRFRKMSLKEAAKILGVSEGATTEWARAEGLKSLGTEQAEKSAANKARLIAELDQHVEVDHLGVKRSNKPLMVLGKAYSMGTTTIKKVFADHGIQQKERKPTRFSDHRPRMDKDEIAVCRLMNQWGRA